MSGAHGQRGSFNMAERCSRGGSASDQVSIGKGHQLAVSVLEN